MIFDLQKNLGSATFIALLFQVIIGVFNKNRIMDTVFIKGLEIETVIGIYDWEREIRQTVRLDLDLASNNRKAAVSDAIEDAVNYKAVAKRLIGFVGDSKFQLVETLAERICEIIIDEFGVTWVRLTLHKPGAVSGSESVGVSIERSAGE
jgi:dihydroneopterin aldolase